MSRVASCFARREPRLTCRDMVNGFLMELEDRNCWTLAEAAGHATPCKMQHLLSRAACDDRAMAEETAAWAAGRLAAGHDPGGVVLIVDETADEKSSADCAGASRQYVASEYCPFKIASGIGRRPSSGICGAAGTRAECAR